MGTIYNYSVEYQQKNLLIYVQIPFCIIFHKQVTDTQELLRKLIPYDQYRYPLVVENDQ